MSMLSSIIAVFSRPC